MTNKVPVILIFDVGKTNKKVLLFDRQYNLVYEQSTQVKETEDEDGFPCEDVYALTDWIKTSFQNIQKNKNFELVAVNVAAYGASFVHINDRLQPFLPLYNYLKPYPDHLLNKFYETYGKDGKLSADTASPVLGNLNSGMQLYWLKQVKQDTYKQIKSSLHLPQYISFVLSGMMYTDVTSVGCHTNLWNFKRHDYHHWVYKEKLTDKFSPIVPYAEVSSISNNKIVIGAGLHDSSAALIPYLTTFKEPFILLSTGTWCISLNPFNHTPLTSDDLNNDCLCYLSHQGAPVKASRLFAGNEHEQQVKRLAAHFNTSVDYYKTVLYDASLCKRLHRTKPASAVKTNTAMVEQSAFSQRSLYDFETCEEAYHQLILDLIKQQVVSTMLVMQNAPVKKLFVDGGFSKNDIYMNLLAAAFPHIEVYSATVAQASALGAAIAVRRAWNNEPLSSDLITVTHYKPTYDIVL